MVFLMDARRIAATILVVFMAETRRTTRSIDHQDFSRRVTAIALGCGLHGASRQIEQAVESFVGLDCRDLMSGWTPSYRMLHPSLKPRPTGLLAAANSGEGRCHRSRLILGRQLPKKDATNAHAKVRRPSDRERLNIEQSFLKPCRVVGDENERDETDLAALTNSPPKTMMMTGKTCNFTNKSLRHLPHSGRQLSCF